MSDEGLSRRGLFRFGLGRALRDLDDEPREQPPAPPPDPAAGEHAELRARLREGWEACDGSALWPDVAAELVEAAVVTPMERILDVGCGDGAVARAAVGRGARATGVDDAPGLLARALKLAEEERLEDAVAIHFREADAAALPFADGTFDSTLAAFAPMFCLRTRTALEEMVRVTRPEGVIGLAVWASGGVVARLLRLAAKHDPLPPGVPAPLSWGREEALRDLLEPHAVSFESRQHELQWSFATREEAVQRLLRGFGPLAAAHHRTPLDAEVGEVVDQLAGRGDGPLELTAHYLVVVAERS